MLPAAPVIAQVKVNTKKLIFFCMVISILLSACGAGNVPEPTATSVPSDTPTVIPSETPLPTATFTPVPSDTPMPTVTVPCTDQGWLDIDGTLFYVITSFKSMETYTHPQNGMVKAYFFQNEMLPLQRYIDEISKTEVAPCTQAAKESILKGLSALMTYDDYIYKGGETPGARLINVKDISKDKTNAFHQDVKEAFVDANTALIALNIKLDNLQYLAKKFQNSY